MLLGNTYMNGTNAKVFLLIGPSGAGKTTLITALQQANYPIESLITCTTRPARTHETHGKDYFFLTREQYLAKQQAHELLAPATAYGNSYGIDKTYIAQKLQENHNLVACLTADRVQELKEILADQLVTIFIAPPSLAELEHRLLKRNTENVTNIATRLTSAVEEIKLQDNFDYKIVNNDLDQAIKEFKKIFSEKTGA